MATNMAHEINNPLAIITGTVQSLKRYYKKGKNNQAFVDECLEDIDTTVTRIHKLVQALRIIARKEDATDMSEVNLEVIIEDVLSLCHERFKNGEIKIDIINPKCMFQKQLYCSRITPLPSSRQFT